MDKPPAVHRIKKYMNRRYYDITHSRHLTMDDIYELVRSGQSVQVTDSQNDTATPDAPARAVRPMR